MKDINIKLTEEEILNAVTENKIKSGDLLTELKPLIEEYFISVVGENEKYLELVFLNGQKFRLYIDEI